MIPRNRTPVTCVLLLACASIPFDPTVHAKGKKKPQGGTPTVITPDESERFTVDGIREPSGIALHPRLHHLFVVGDEGTVGELDGDGRTIRVDRVPANLEDLVFHPQSGTLVLLVEDPPALVVYDPVARAEKRRIPLDVTALLGRAPAGRKGQGFEGLAFHPEPGRAGGGVFYLAHQRSPATIVLVAFDPLQAVTVGKEALVGRRPMDPYRHLTAISYDASRDRFLLIADGRLVVLGAGLETEARSQPLPMPHPEGVCVDEGGAVWIADDPTGLVRFEGGVAALASGSAGGSTRNR
jgi:uncharacterized protein YjiK